MQWPGGGPHGVAPGQITDDSELAMCLMWGLLESNMENPEPAVLNLDRIAE